MRWTKLAKTERGQGRTAAPGPVQFKSLQLGGHLNALDDLGQDSTRAGPDGRTHFSSACCN